jgi:predicted TIM-barrel fold metal-dependent hydrolase
MVEHLGVFREFLDEEQPGFGARYEEYGKRVKLRGEGSKDADRHWRYQRTPWWGHAGETHDRATSFAPGLLYDRLDELGVDVTVIYPSVGLGVITVPDADMRIPAVTAFNKMMAELWQPYRDRVVPAAAIPMHEVAETIEHLRTAKQLGFKVVAISANVARPIPGVAALSHAAYPAASWPDQYGLDSQYDYSPVWREVQRLGLALTSHGNTASRYVHNGRHSPTNFMFNHIGSHSYQQGELARSLYMWGITRKFPSLGFAFLECGVSWAVQMLFDLVERWEKRGGKNIWQYDPARIDWAEFGRLLREKGGTRYAKIGLVDDPLSMVGAAPDDDFGAIPTTTAEQMVADFAANFYYGCNGDDLGTSWAFRNPGGFATDISHWDVPDMASCVAESYKFVTRGHLNEEEYRKFVFDHAVEFYLKANPEFFKGTVIEQYLPKARGAAAAGGTAARI